MKAFEIRAGSFKWLFGGYAPAFLYIKGRVFWVIIGGFDLRRKLTFLIVCDKIIIRKVKNRSQVKQVKNGYKIFDSHCHIYPERIAAKAVKGTDNFYGVESFANGTTAELIEHGTRAGTDKFLVHSVATTAKQVRSINEFIASSVEASGGKFIGFGTLYPESDDIAGDFDHLVRLGLRGIKIHPDIQHFKIDHAGYLKMYELAEREGIVVLMHTGDDRYDFSNPNRLVPVLKIFTGLTVIGAHFGGYSIWEEASRELSGFENLYVDSSSSLPYISKELAAQMIRRYGADHVLYGTDFPMWSPEKSIDDFFALGLSDDENRSILWGNAERLFGI